MDALERYIHDHTEPEEELLRELDRETHQRMIAPRMLSGHVQGRLLEMIVRMVRPQRVLEIGTFTGYSALSMAAGIRLKGQWATQRPQRMQAEGTGSSASFSSKAMMALVFFMMGASRLGTEMPIMGPP